jgi:hypothetical protein
MLVANILFFDQADPPLFFSPRIVTAPMPANTGERSALPWFGAAKAGGQALGGQRTDSRSPTGLIP